MMTNYTVPPNFGELVRAERMIRGWTMQELAERTGLHIATIRGVESGTTKRPKWFTTLILGIHTGMLVFTYTGTDPDGMERYDWLPRGWTIPAQGTAL